MYDYNDLNGSDVSPIISERNNDNRKKISTTTVAVVAVSGVAAVGVVATAATVVATGTTTYVISQHIFQTASQKYDNMYNDNIKIGKFLYSAVSSPQDRSKRFTLYFPDRPVHSDTICCN